MELEVSYKLATEEQKDLALNARRILEKELTWEKIQEYEAADGGKGCYPMDVHQVMVDAGYYAMSIPEEYGGLGFDPKTIAIIHEEMARVEAGFTFSFNSNGSHFGYILATSMPEEKKREWAEIYLAGKTLGCFALTEPDAGSDAAAMRTTAVKKGDEYVINGTKCFITNAAEYADHFCVAAWTDKTKSAREGVTFFFVEKDRGVQIGKHEDKMGMKLSPTGELIFEDVVVPADHVIGEVGGGFGASMNHIQMWGRPGGSAIYLGLAQACFDEAVAYAKVRRQFGKRIIDHQGVGFKIARMQERLYAARSYLYTTFDTLAAGYEDRNMTAGLKKFVTDVAYQNAYDAMQIFGGYGYMHEYRIEKLFRDSRIFPIFGGTNEIQLKNMAKAIAGRDPEKKK
ncbi:MAG: acyl-CoA/acyl-ACP dehydrogenase [Lachnospiraceae bacterium]|nr:acyl-CoA/acyl-ACP dehydrogenase [Lachnospiraceae bacterium]